MTTTDHPPTHQLNTTAHTEMRVPLRRVKALYEVNEALRRVDDEQQVLESAAHGLVQIAGYLSCWITTVDRAANVLRGRAGVGPTMTPETITMDVPLDVPHTMGEVVKTRETVIVPDAVKQADLEGWGDIARQIKLASVAYVPFNTADSLGVLAISTPVSMQVEEETTLLNLFASQLTAALVRVMFDRERAAQIAAMEAAAEQQARLLQTVRDLSTPAMPVYDGVLVMPLVGHVDSLRAGQIMETVLTGISREHASVVIIDVTGVPVIDTGVANYLVQVTQAAQLLGARALLVGITPEVAQTLVQLGVDLSGIATRANLQMGVAYALQQRGLRVVEAAT